MVGMTAVTDVRLVDLEFIRRYSLAVRQESAPAEELAEVLRATLAAVEKTLPTKKATPTKPSPKKVAAKKVVAKKTAAPKAGVTRTVGVKSTAAKKAPAKKTAGRA